VLTITESMVRQAADEAAGAPALQLLRTLLTSTCAELYAAARRSAGALASRGVERGETVLLCLESGPALLAAFLGCELLGAVPAIVSLPRAGEGWQERAEWLFDVTSSRTLVADEALAGPAISALAGLTGGVFLAPADLLSGDASRAPAHRVPSSGEAALVAISEGETPRAKTVTQRELVARARAIAHDGGWTMADCVASRRSLHDEAGLLAALTALSCGLPVVLLAPPASSERKAALAS
jgi:acyl-CoA synthetase (AMP-forming)/AMP-acid ligase II